MYRRFLVILICGLVLVGSGAGSLAKGKNRFKAALEEFNKKNYQAALSGFEPFIAKRSNARPHALYYAAVCCQYLGQHQKAKLYYTQILTDYPALPVGKLATRALSAMSGTKLRPRTRRARRSSPSSAGYVQGTSPGDSLPEQTQVQYNHSGKGSILIGATIGKRKTEMVFDTSFDACLVGKNHLSRLGLTMTESASKSTIQGLAGPISVTVLQTNLTVGGLRRKTRLNVQEKQNVEPILGHAFFQGYTVDFDNERGILTAYKSGTAPPLKKSRAVLPFSRQGGNLVFNAVVNGRSCPMLLDTGSRFNTFPASRISSYGIGTATGNASSAITDAGGNKAQVKEGIVKSLTAGSIKKSVTKTLVINSKMASMGMAFFEPSNIRLDYPGSKLIFW